VWGLAGAYVVPRGCMGIRGCEVDVVLVAAGGS